MAVVPHVFTTANWYCRVFGEKKKRKDEKEMEKGEVVCQYLWKRKEKKIKQK